MPEQGWDDTRITAAEWERDNPPHADERRSTGRAADDAHGSFDRLRIVDHNYRRTHRPRR